MRKTRKRAMKVTITYEYNPEFHAAFVAKCAWPFKTHKTEFGFSALSFADAKANLLSRMQKYAGIVIPPPETVTLTNG